MYTKKILAVFVLIALSSIAVLATTQDTVIVKRSDVGYQGPSFAQIQKLPLVANIRPSGNANTDITKMQRAIDDASEKNGGRIIVHQGTYELSNIQLKSNVHILFKERVLITPRKNSNAFQNIFLIAKDENEHVGNLTFIGEGDSTSRPHIYYDRTIAASARAFNIGKVTNLYIQNFSITDDQTKYSAISFHPRKNGSTKNDRGKNITIRKVSLLNASYGYGLAQCNVGENMWLNNLQTVGGVAARIETHTGREFNVGVDNVVIENVSCTNGKAAVTMQPHVVDNGIVTVDGAKAVNSEWCVMVKDGFISSKLDKTKEWTIGTFTDGSSIKNVEMIHGSATTVGAQSVVYIPNSLLSLYYNDSIPDVEDGSSRLGPSIAAILNLAKDEVTIDANSIKHSGDRANERLLIVTKEVDRSAATVIKQVSTNSPTFSINNSLNEVNVSFITPFERSTLSIFNLQGRLLQSTAYTNSNRIREQLYFNKKDVYIAHVRVDNEFYSYKFITNQ